MASVRCGSRTDLEHLNNTTCTKVQTYVKIRPTRDGGHQKRSFETSPLVPTVRPITIGATALTPNGRKGRHGPAL